jgi:hypothetical protein
MAVACKGRAVRHKTQSQSGYGEDFLALQGAF